MSGDGEAKGREASEAGAPQPEATANAALTTAQGAGEATPAGVLSDADLDAVSGGQIPARPLRGRAEGGRPHA